MLCRKISQSIRPIHSFGFNNSNEIRKSFFGYFLAKGHILVPSASVIPHEKKADFTFAGVQQFSEVVIGEKQPLASRIVNSQKCIRLGGDHISDVELVAADTYHHTFFEMLGNWSFGDYYKKEACNFAWDYLTNVLGIQKSRLYVTFFHGDENIEPDLETRDIWLAIGVPSSHIIGFGQKHNFWQAGPIGPCGPCSEIHVDKLHRSENMSQLLNSNDPTLVELWNIVFMESYRMPDDSLTPLPVKNIDTGMGFERLCAVLQGYESAYETDLFQPLLLRIQELSGNRHKYQGRTGIHDKEGVDAAYRIVSDHMRTVVVALADGIRFTEETQKKYARKIKDLFKRATLYAHESLKMERHCMTELVPVIVEQLADAYPEIQESQCRIIDTIKAEEKRLWKQRDEGMTQLERMFRSQPRKSSIFPGKLVFIIVQNYRIELELVRKMAAQKGLTIDEEGYKKLYAQKTSGIGLRIKGEKL